MQKLNYSIYIQNKSEFQKLIKINKFLIKALLFILGFLKLLCPDLSNNLNVLETLFFYINMHSKFFYSMKVVRSNLGYDLFIFWLALAVLRNSSWHCAQGYFQQFSVLMGFLGLFSGLQHPSQMPYLFYLFSNTLIFKISSLSFQEKISIWVNNL